MDSQPTSGNEVQFEIDPLGEPVISLGTIRLVSDTGSRSITDHRVGKLNEAIFIEALGQPGAGGAFTAYGMSLEIPFKGRVSTTVKFQDGPLDNDDFNGFTNESYLAILISRMRGFQSGKFACDENAKILFHLQQAMSLMKLRTLGRQERGVEGTHTA